MKVVILAGGFGSRLGEYTMEVPKPMVKIGGKPILWHIMKHYSSYGYNDFYIALGYKSEIIKKYFVDFHILNSNFTINLSNGELINIDESENWRVSLVDTGIDTMTGGRLKKLKPYIGNETFLLTYGDGVSDINLEKLLKFHKSEGKIATVTAVRPGARFGELQFNENIVQKFEEKPQTFQGWVNGGFFVLEPKVFEFIENDKTIFEQEPLEKISSLGELAGFKHKGFWQCMDTKRDKDFLENLIQNGNPPWFNKL